MFLEISIFLSISSSNEEQQLLSFSAILNCHKIQTTLSLYFVSSVTSQSFIKIKKNSFRKNSTRIRSREEDTRRALAGRTFSRDGISWHFLIPPPPEKKLARCGIGGHVARLSLAARRILSSGVVFHSGRTKGYIYMRRRARRRHVIVFEVTAIGTCEENVECSYTRVPLIENEHVQHPSLRGLFSSSPFRIQKPIPGTPFRIEILLFNADK